MADEPRKPLAKYYGFMILAVAGLGAWVEGREHWWAILVLTVFTLEGLSSVLDQSQVPGGYERDWAEVRKLEHSVHQMKKEALKTLDEERRSEFVAQWSDLGQMLALRRNEANGHDMAWTGVIEFFLPSLTQRILHRGRHSKRSLEATRSSTRPAELGKASSVENR